MWYEILPSLFLVGAFLYIPRVITYKYNIIRAGTEQRRDLTQLWDRIMYTRDVRVAGSPWRTIETAGLETIPDK